MPGETTAAAGAVGAVVELSPPKQPEKSCVAASNPASLIDDVENCRLETKAALPIEVINLSAAGNCGNVSAFADAEEGTKVLHESSPNC